MYLRFKSFEGFLFWLLVVAAFCLAALLRICGQNWDEGQLLNPDERFLVMVTSVIRAVHSWTQYFDTANSTLNPNNNGFGFYVYGTLPLFLWRYIANAFGSEASIYLIGRSISAAFDLGTCSLVFISAWFLFGRWAGLLSLFISATCVLQIQLSHFGTFDSYGAFFSTLGLFLSILISRVGWKHSCYLVIFAGIACGSAMATKINLGLTFALLPLSLLIANLSAGKVRALLISITLSTLSLFVFAVTFRLFQPYAFIGPEFFNLQLNPKWLENIKSLTSLGTENHLDFPPGVQWYERTRLHGLINLITWGFGLPMGLLAMGSLLFAGYRSLWREFPYSKYNMPFVWAVLTLTVYVLVYVIQPMRYGVPVYPALSIIMAGIIVPLFQSFPAWLVQRWNRFELNAVRIVIGLVLISSLIWAIAFIRIYRTENTRLAASRWILREVPGVVNFAGRSNAGESFLPLTIPGEAQLVSFPLNLSIWIPFDFLANKILIPKVLKAKDGDRFSFEVKNGITIVARGEFQALNGQLEQTLSRAISLQPRINYQLIVKPLEATNAQIQRISLARESSWDDSLPYRVDGFDPYGGIYDGTSNLEIYWRDQAAKPKRLADILANSDYFYLSSNRQVGTIGRLPKEFPIAALFYQKLLGCSAREYIPECYAEARVGERSGQLGFELVETFESYPGIWGLSINTQLADEAFQVYDHPKVMIFKNKEKLTSEKLEKLLTPVKFQQDPQA